MSKSFHYKFKRRERPRRSGLKMLGHYRCKCCYVAARAKAQERERRLAEIKAQLLEVPDEERVFSDFRELPDDIFEPDLGVHQWTLTEEQAARLAEVLANPPPASETLVEALKRCKPTVVRLSDSEAASLFCLLYAPPKPPNSKFVELFKKYGTFDDGFVQGPRLGRSSLSFKVEDLAEDDDSEYAQMLRNTCSPEEAQRRMDWAQETLDKILIKPKGKS